MAEKPQDHKDRKLAPKPRDYDLGDGVTVTIKPPKVKDLYYIMRASKAMQRMQEGTDRMSDQDIEVAATDMNDAIQRCVPLVKERGIDLDAFHTIAILENIVEMLGIDKPEPGATPPATSDADQKKIASPTSLPTSSGATPATV